MLKTIKTIKTIVLTCAAMASLVATGRMVSYSSDGDIIIPPYEEDWQGEGVFDRYVVVDCNEDKRTWTFSNGQVRYHYSSVNAADDWLLTPEILLESGKVYEFLATAFAVSDSYTERIEISLGQGVDPASFTQVVVPPTDLNGSTPQELPATFTVSEGGYYRIGFHAISEKNHFFLTLQGWSLDVLVESGAPSVVTDLQVVPGEKGARMATLSFIAPATSVSGDSLTELDRIEVSSKGSLLATIDHPVPGEAQEIEVTVEEDGYHDFDVVACNAIGIGMPAHANVYVGCDVPILQGVVGCVDLRDGKMACSWSTAGEVGEHGGYVDSTAVEYRLYPLDASGSRAELLATTTETSCVVDYSSFDTGAAQVLQVEVEPVFAEKEGVAIGGRLIIGKPYILPYHQSFDSSSQGVFWWQEADGGQWLASQMAADADGACLRFVADDSIARGKACSEKLTLKGASRPMLLFQHNTKAGQNIRLHVFADRQDADGPVLLKTILPDEEKSDSWVQEGIDLSEYVEEDYILLTFIVEADEKGAVCRIDDIQVRDVPDCDLELVSVLLPKQVKVGHEEMAVVTVRNNGLLSVGDDAYAVEFTVGDSTVTVGTKELAPFTGATTYTFTFTPSIFDEVLVEVSAKVVCSEDLEEGNNVATAVASVKQPSVARMVNLTAEAYGSDVSLTWNLPNGSLSEGIYTEDFEDTEIFGNLSTGGVTADNHWGELGQWKLYDGNGTPVRIVEVNDSDSIGSDAPKAFQVFNAFENGLDMTDYDVVESMASYSGEQMLLAMPPADGQPSDKWLISPLLSGGEQTISLFVSATANDPETTFEVWYTTTNTPDDLEHYQLAYNGVASTMDWNEVRLELPVGVRYFAIRSTASGAAGFMLDDITFTASPSSKMPKAARPTLTGCHVYRDQVLIAQLDAGVVEYVDNEVVDGQHTYYVTAVYGETESGLSNPAVVDVDITAIPDVAASAARFGDDIMVYDLRGVLLGHGRDCFNSQPRGVYIIKDMHTGRVARVSRK